MNIAGTIIVAVVVVLVAVMNRKVAKSKEDGR
jgi:hypothetical protein